MAGEKLQVIRLKVEEWANETKREEREDRKDATETNKCIHNARDDREGG